MGQARAMTANRLKEILRRQRVPEFGAGYEPAIKATREEAPAGSRPATVWSQLLARDVHTLSVPERKVLALLLYCPSLFELQEQRMLPFLPAPHPLHGHPRAKNESLRDLRGTLAVAEERGCLSFHPSVNVDGEEVPACWIGDFLGFFTDRLGPYCVNFNVKSTREEFAVPQVGISVRTDKARAAVKEGFRHLVERELYADIEIRTVEVAADELPPMLTANLLQQLQWQKREHLLSDEQVQIVLDGFNLGLVRRATPLNVMVSIEQTHGIPRYKQRILFEQGVFARKIRIDLFDSHIFTEKPMLPERTDALEAYANWFRRGP
jgi:hypothetical protein